jgi:PAS domain S-box-containing protein
MKVLLIDDSAVVCSRLRALLAEIEGLQIVGQVGDATAAGQAARTLSPDVVILDLQLAGGSGIDLLRDLKTCQPTPLVIMLTNYAHPLYRRKCLDAGADFFFDKAAEFASVRQVCIDLLASPVPPVCTGSRESTAASRHCLEVLLRESEERYRLIVENAFDLICELDREARHRYCSPNYRDVLGYAPEELLGRVAFAYVHPDDLPMVRAQFGKPAGQLTFRCRHKSGEWRWLESTGREYYTAQGEWRAVIVSRDVTARQQLEEARRCFLTTISHEFRTPLNVIMGYTDLLLTGNFGPLSTTQSEPLRRIDSSARRLLDLVDAALMVSRLAAGQLPLQITTFSLPDLCDEIATAMRELLADKPHLRTLWQVQPGLHLRTDRAKLRVILTNLLRNAVQYTAQGTILVTAEARDGGAMLSVADTGAGIAPEALPTIFELLQCRRTAAMCDRGGLGVGLYIVKRLVELLGGRVTVESEVRHGSTFRVWVPHSPLSPP